MDQQVYRQAASVLVLRRRVDGNGFEFLLLHKPRKNDSWQLPQGGVEPGETLREAALRELQEEASVEGCTVLRESGRVYQYDFPPSYRRFRPDNVIGQQIGFLLAVAPEGAEVQVDRNEVNDFAWIVPADIGRYIRRPEYAEIVKGLYEEAIRSLQGNDQ